MDIDAFRQMVAKNPRGFLGRYGLGNKILQEGGSLEEAVEHLRIAVQLDPLHVASHLALGRALIGIQEPGEAQRMLQAGIEAAVSGKSNGGRDLIPEMQALLRTMGDDSHGP
jgi:predicted Zn-dependent protease